MARVQRPPNAPESAREQRRPPLEWRLRQDIKRLQAENDALRGEVAALRDEVVSLVSLVGDLDPDGSGTYAWQFGIG